MMQEQINNKEILLETMVENFINRRGNLRQFKDFANSIKNYCHSDKWSNTYDYFHNNFTFENDEDDGKIITKFVELVEKDKV